MRPIVGLGVSPSAVTAVAVDRGVIAWRDQIAVESAESIGAAVTMLLRSWKRIKGARVIAAFGAHFSRVNAVRGLESVHSAAIVSEAVAASADRFFLRIDGGMCVSPASRLADGNWHAAAFSLTTLGAVGEACAAAGAELDRVIPALSQSNRIAAAGVREWIDTSVNPFAGAQLAAGSRRGAPLSLPSASSVARSGRVLRMRRAVLAGCAALAAVSALAAPAVSAEHQRRAAEHALAHDQTALRPVAAAMAQLTESSRLLEQIDDFAASRRSMLGYLSALARALPESTAVLSLNIDSVAVTTVLVTRAGPGVLDGLARVPGLEAPRVLGPFSREQIGGVELERVAVRSLFATSRAVPAKAVRK